MAHTLHLTASEYRAGPAARVLLQRAGLQSSDVNPTGPNGIVTKGDVLAAMTQTATSSKKGAQKSESPPAPPAEPAQKPQPSTSGQQSKATSSGTKANPPAPSPQQRMPTLPERTDAPHVDIPNSQVSSLEVTTRPRWLDAVAMLRTK